MAEGWFAGPAPPAEPAVAAEPAPEIRPAPMDAPAVAPHLRAGRAGRAGRAEPAVAAEPAPEIRPAPTAAPAVAPHLRAARNAPVPAEPAPDVRPAPTDAPAPAEPAPPPPIEHDPTTLRHLQNNEIPGVLRDTCLGDLFVEVEADVCLPWPACEKTYHICKKYWDGMQEPAGTSGCAVGGANITHDGLIHYKPSCPRVFGCRFWRGQNGQRCGNADRGECHYGHDYGKIRANLARWGREMIGACEFIAARGGDDQM